MNATITRISVLLLLMFFTVDLPGQVIPETQRVDWSVALQSYACQTPTNEVNVKDFGAAGDGVNNDWQAVKDAIASFDGRLGYVYFPPGNYLINSPLVLPDSIILKGDANPGTTLGFDLNNESKNCIIIKGNQDEQFFNIDDGFTKGSRLLIADSAYLLSAGDFAEIRQQNGDWDDKPIGWADYAVGQILEISSVSGDSIFLKQELHIDYQAGLYPQIRKTTPVSNSGIQCLKIKRKDQPVSGGGANVFLSFAINCFVRGVESDTSAGSHIDIVNSLNILIDGNYIHHAFEYDGASKHGYGITMNNHTTSCLITNNIFYHLRHAMMVKTGANGNVFSYNYSTKVFRTEWPDDYGGDISLHGHYPFANLFEGNIVQNIFTDHYWGPAGPYNTIFRNRAEDYGIIMTNGDPTTTDNQNYVGNETTDDSFLHGMYSLTGEHQFEYGNNILGEIVPSETADLQDNSYYLTEKPYFWPDNLDWPTIGLPNENGAGTIPAKQRFIDNELFTVCPDSLATSVNESGMKKPNLKVWPNPVGKVLNVEIAETAYRTCQIINLNGQPVLEFIINRSIQLKLPDRIRPGLYFLVIHGQKKIGVRKLLITK